MTAHDLRQKLSDLIAFQCVLVSLRGVGAEASEEMLWQTLLPALVEQYGFHLACYTPCQDGGIHRAVRAPGGDAWTTAPRNEKPAVVDVPVWIEGKVEGHLLLSGGDPASPERVEQLRILAAEAATMLAEWRFRAASGKALKHARLQAEAANRAKSLLLANMSHEIRTPLTGVLGFSDLLAATPLTAQQREYVETIQSSGTALLTLLNDILDFSKVEAGKLKMERLPLNVRLTVEQAVGLLVAQAAEKRLRLFFQVDPTTPRFVLGDIVRVRQVLINLLSNAVKFTAAGEVSISVSAAPYEGGRVCLSFLVRDTGPGISREDQGRIFDSFSQADASISRKHGGTGLGLAISRMLAEEMGGGLRLESEPGRGASFTFSMVTEVAAETTSVNPAPAHSGLAPLPDLRIAVADDNPVNRKLAQAMLKRLGYEVATASDGVELLEKMRREAYDVIFMDMHMPEVDGLEATRRIRGEWPAERQPRIIAMTAAAFPEDRARCLEAGMDDFVAKPVMSGQLIEVLQRACPEADRKILSISP